MSKPDLAQAYLEWTKQKLDESAATLAKLDEAATKLTADASAKAQEALGQFREARDAFKVKVDALQADLSASKQVTDTAMAAVSAQWTEVEMAFQQFLKTSGDQASLVRTALAARAEAQRQSFQASLESIQASTATALEQGRKELDTALRRWTDEAEKTLGPKLSQLSAAGDETWSALKTGLDETAAVYEKTWGKITQAFSKMK
jgi:DNA anti-recombination protein RmuC